MTPGIILTRVTIIAMSLCHCHVARRQLDTWHFFNFKKIIIKKFKKSRNWHVTLSLTASTLT